MTTTSKSDAALDDPAGSLARATFITADADRPMAIELATSVELDRPPGQVADARVVATAHGVYEFTIDGAPITDSVLNPGWSAYEWRLHYQQFDVTDIVRGGGPTLDLRARIGNGWYRGDLGFESANANYGTEIGLLAALEITYTDGSVQRVTTTTDWTGRTCEVTANSLYNGQRIDARLRGTPGRVLAVRPSAFDLQRLVLPVKPPVLRQEVIAPQKIWTSPTGSTLVDFGQNLVGWLRVRVGGPAGTEVILRHAEVLENGELGSRPLRGAQATDTFILSGRGEDVFEPTFTFHGFRFVEITGWPGDLTMADVDKPGTLEAIVVHSELRPTSEFTCSEPLVNQLVQNSVWGQKGNFLEVPTDCPQRDERLGWTGDIAAYAGTASFQFDTADFLHAWLLDLKAETQHTAGNYVPVVIPDVLKYAQFDDDQPAKKIGAQAVWGDAAAWVPEALWNAYADTGRLAEHYPGMVMHLESVLARLSDTGLWDTDWQLGDWLDPDAPADQPEKAKADSGVVATACLYRSAGFAANTARILGLDRDADRWAVLAERTRAAFRRHYVTPSDDGSSGRITSDCATVYALAIRFGVLSEDETVWAGARLVELVRDNKYRITTGFAGTPFVTWALSETGHIEDAYRLLLEKQCPSWLYPITMGATTIWERWDSMLPDGSINPGEMTSFNHYALGAVADWLYQVVAGIRAGSPGYATIRIQPVPGPGIDWVTAAYESRVGRIEVSWKNEDAGFALDVTIPDGIPADIVLPNGHTEQVRGGTHHFTA